MPPRKRAKLIAVCAPVASAIVAAVVLSSCFGGDSKDDTAAEDEGLVPTIACTLGAEGVNAIVEGLLKEENVKSIIVTLGAALGSQLAADALCKAAIRTLVQTPDKEVTLNLETRGALFPTVVTGSDLATRPPPMSEVNVMRLIDCLDWNSDYLYELCADGTLPPPR
jgi:hypothetical protein